MSTIYGFLQDNYFLNGSSTPNPVGQISNKSLTYAPTGIFTAANSAADLYIFNPNLVSALVSSTVLEQLATTLSVIPNYPVGLSSVLNDIVGILGAGFTNISIGALVYNPTDAKNYPSSISFTYTNGGVSHNYQIWLADTNFQNEYPSGVITVLTPIADLSNLYGNFALCNAAIGALTPLSMSQLIEAQQEAAPLEKTVIYFTTFRVFNVTNSSQWFDLPVAYICNGGTLFCNTASCKAAFINALLTESLFTLQQWEVIIPTLVPTNKFYVIPNLSNEAIAVGTPIQSPTINLSTTSLATLQTTYFPDYGSSVDALIDYTVALYNSIGLFILPCNSNLTSATFHDTFGDYFLVSTNDVIINRMSVNTQQMVTLLTNMLVLITTTNVLVTLPAGYSIEVRNGFNYLVGNVGTTTLSVLI